ncbi:MAG: YbfB/YjiJ family MFS transporter [Planctomycetaceae bacterium]|nr:YbfB/YjiJ family MFS transporter [Planctomycetaceae bacterium]
MNKHHPVYATLAGFCLIGIGLCLCRYAYTPLIPSMVDGDWVTKPGAGYLGGFNCMGYLLGCVSALFLPRHVGIRFLLRISLVLAVVGQAMCAWDLGFAWLALGRFVTGFAGASIVIHTPTLVLQHVPERWTKIVSGLVFAGAGSTIVLVCLILPIFLRISISAGWLFEAGLTLVAGVIAWPIIRSASTAQDQRKSTIPKLNHDSKVALLLLGTAYFLASISITPHTLFLTNYLHEQFGASIEMSSQLFSLVGVGSLVGALTSGLFAKLFGTPLTLLVNYLVGSISVFMVLITTSVNVITVSAFMIGFFLMCCVPLTSIRSGEISGSVRHARDWGVLTLLFGSGLAVGSYGMSGLLSLGLNYYQLFVIAQVTSATALLLALVLYWMRRKVGVLPTSTGS